MWTEEVWNDTRGKEEFEKIYEKPHCIVLDSEYCSMGRMIAIRACEKSGYTYYGAEELLELEGVSAENASAKVFENAVEKALAQGPCLIHEKTIKEIVEQKGYSCLSVMTYATEMKSKLVRAKVDPKYKALEAEDELRAVIEKEDQNRREYHNALSSKLWGDKETYDILLNAEVMGMDKCIRLLAAVMEA